MQIKENIKVSVIIPCYNAESTIEECILSVLNQSINIDLEIVVVDDGSTDRSLEILKKFKESIILILKGENILIKGASTTRNRGLEFATGDLICFLDSDDYYLPGYINGMTSALLSDASLGYVFCKQKCLKSTGDLNSWTRKDVNKWDVKYHVLHRAKVISTNVIMIRKDVVQNVGFFDISLRNGEDSDYWIRVSENSIGKFLNFYGAVYRIDHSESQLTNSLDLRNKLKLSQKVLYKALYRSVDLSKDNIRLIIIIKNLIYSYATQKRGIIFTLWRFLYSSLILFLLFPIDYFMYLYGSIKDGKN